MKRWTCCLLAAAWMLAAANSIHAEDAAAKAVLDKAVKALGGEAKLTKAETYIRKAKGTITFNGNDSSVTLESTIQGLDRARNDFEGQFGDNKVKGTAVLNGDKGWRKFNDNLMELDANALANEKRGLYLLVVPARIVPIFGKGFQYASDGEEKIDKKAAVKVKITAPDGKDFTISFDKESGLPVKVVARVAGIQGQEFTQETIYSDYKDVDGIKRPMKVSAKRDGQSFMEQEVNEFKVLDKVDPKTFEKPE